MKETTATKIKNRVADYLDIAEELFPQLFDRCFDRDDEDDELLLVEVAKMVQKEFLK